MSGTSCQRGGSHDRYTTSTFGTRMHPKKGLKIHDIQDDDGLLFGCNDTLYPAVSALSMHLRLSRFTLFPSGFPGSLSSTRYYLTPPAPPVLDWSRGEYDDTISGHDPCLLACPWGIIRTMKVDCVYFTFFWLIGTDNATSAGWISHLPTFGSALFVLYENALVCG